MFRNAILLLIFATVAHADFSNPGLYDYQFNGISSNQSTGTRNAVDVELLISGSIIDPRSRTWTTSSGTDSMSCVQSTSPWVDNISQFGGSNVVTGVGNSGAGIPRVTVSSDSSITNITGTVSLPTGASTLTAQTNVQSAPGTAQTTALTVQGNASGIQIPVSQGTPGSVASPWPVTAVSPSPPTDLTVTGTLSSLSSVVTLNLNGTSSVNVDVSGSGFVGTIQVQEAYPSGGRILSALALNSSAATSSITTTGNYRIFGVPTAGTIQAVFSAYTSGSATVTIRASTGTFYVNPMNFNAFNNLTSAWLSDGSGNLLSSNSGALNHNLTQVANNTVNTGTGASSTGTQRVAVSNDSQVQLWNGTNVAKVVAGSTSPALTDTALVITDRPDNVGTPTQTSVSCAATSTTLLAASTATMFISIRNPTTSTVTIWINVAGAAAVVGVPSIDLAPGSEADFFAEGAGFLPTSAITCISSGAASSVALTYK